MTTQLLLTMALVFCSTMAAVLVAQYYATRSQRLMDRRFRVVVEGVQESLPASGTASLGERFPMVTEKLRGSSYFHYVARKLVAAGIAMRAGEFVTLCVLIGAIGFLIAAVWCHRLFPSIGWGCVFFAIPHFILNFLVGHRRQILENQLADTLVMVSSALQGGFSFLQGIQMAADQMPQPISLELQRMGRLVQLGMPLDEALQQLGDRVQSYDYDLMVAATTLQLSTGGNLVQLFKTITTTIEERLRIRREIKATTAEGRLSATVLVLMPVAMLGILMVIKPDYAHSMLFTPIGQSMLKGAAGLQLMGILAIQRILNLDL
ncbi:MAG TPA: type II secretion system F family protein [Armatimonadota bacterium]|nr:type II secretion system F family protein [Armatimonadota bacterium]